MSSLFRIALAGNPNSGKTSLFNQLTGARQQVANYPGVTVEKRTGLYAHNGHELSITDLPGAYSLAAYSIEESVARDFILEEKPDVIVNVLDASNLERNLYLTLEVMELGIPMVLALNMSDVAKVRGITFDLEKLSTLLGAPVIETVAIKGAGIAALLESIVAVAMRQSVVKKLQIPLGRELEEASAALSAQIAHYSAMPAAYDPAWTAIKLLEEDKQICAKIKSAGILRSAAAHIERLEKRLGDLPGNLITERRYTFIAQVCRNAVRSTPLPHRHLSDRIDAVMTHRAFSIPIFLGMMYLVFQLTFSLGGPPMGWIETGFAWLGATVSSAWPADSQSALRSLLVDGIIGGVGGVLIFLPNILLLFMAIAILEDSGYMARVAFIMDRLMHKIGLHGKSFIPMLTGFGCSVPAIMATRTLDNERDRFTTILVIPLMSCGARLPIYTLIIPAFFPANLHAPMLWLIYSIGIVLAVIVAKCLRSTLFQGEAQPFIMELPPWRVPTLGGVLLHMWDRGWVYLKKAGTIILAISIVLWFLSSYPKKKVFDEDYESKIAQLAAQGMREAALSLTQEQQAEALAFTFAGRIGRGLEPLLKPLGFDWRVGTALIGAFAAKEVFVAQLGIVYAVGEADEESAALRERLRSNYSPLSAFCIMLFCLISAPCMATIAVTKRETNSWKWAMFQLGGLTGLAYGVTFVTYQVGSVLGAICEIQSHG